MTMDKHAFLNSELGRKMVFAVDMLDVFLDKLSKCEPYFNDYAAFNSCVNEETARIDAFALAIKYFYGIKYVFVRNSQHYGLITEDKSDWLYKRPRH